MDWPVLAGSVTGVLGLVLAAWWLGLGGGAIDGEAEALRAAEEAQVGFVAESAVVSSDRQAALVRCGDGSVVLLKVHGAHISARRLTPPIRIRAERDGVVIATGERMFGDVRLRLDSDARDKLQAMV